MVPCGITRVSGLFGSVRGAPGLPILVAVLTVLQDRVGSTRSSHPTSRDEIDTILKCWWKRLPWKNSTVWHARPTMV